MISPRLHAPARKSRFAPSPRPPRPSSCRSKVRVVVRIRPFLPSELLRFPSLPSVTVSKCSGSDSEDTLHITDLATSRQGSYKLDFCYGEGDDINLIFEREVKPILPALFLGRNATVFAYGATGSGKTFTMQGLEDRPGLMPLALTNLIAMSEHKKSHIEVSYYEVYMDRCYDLLEAKANEVSVLEDNDGKIQLRGLSQVQVKTLEQFREVFSNGCLRRRVGQTGLNDASSRSHGVLMVTVTTEDDTTGLQVVGKLNLIDLAGNEDNRRSGNEGVRLAESARINQSLFALSNVINALNSNEARVPYRDSKLTRILQDSLGGTSRALMIACLSPRSYQEAAHTLGLAARSRQIMNPVCEEDRYKDSQDIDMVEKLHAWLESKGKKPPASPTPSKIKPHFSTPSRHHINRLRQIEGNFVKDSYETPRARRVLASSLPNDDVEEGKERELAQTSSQRAKSLFTDGNKSSCSDEKENQELRPAKVENERVPEAAPPSSQQGKENVCKEILPFTPYEKVAYESSSPPLSERLQNLRSAMREILQPISNNLEAPRNATSLKMETLSPWKSSDTNLSPLVSPEKTPTRITNLEAKSAGTPLEKFSRHSSGIKGALMKEYLDFLNTASREELLELKGIGEKRAAYILSLREFSPEPLKELEDLEKIGLSKRQALSLFKDTARRIF